MANFGQYRSAADGSIKDYTSAPLLASKTQISPGVLAGTKALMASTNPRANTQGSAQPQGGQEQPDVPATLDSAIQAIQASIGGIQKAQQAQLKEKTLLEMRKELMMNPAIQAIMQSQAKSGGKAAGKSTKIEGSESVDPLQQRQTNSADIGNLIENSINAGNTIESTGKGINTVLDSIRAQQQQDVEAAQAGLTANTSLLNSLINVNEEGRAQSDQRMEEELQPYKIKEMLSVIDKNNRAGSGAAANVAPGDPGSLSLVAQQVLRNPALYSQTGFMTPTQKYGVLQELSAYGLTDDQLANLTLPSLPATTKTAVAGLSTIEQFADDALEKLNSGSFGTGIIQSRINAAKSKLGNAPEGWVEYAALTAITSAEQLRQLSGVAVTPQEFDRLRPYLPDVNDAENTAREKLANFKRVVQTMRADKLESGLQTSFELKSGEPDNRNTFEEGGATWKDNGDGTVTRIK